MRASLTHKDKKRAREKKILNKYAWGTKNSKQKLPEDKSKLIGEEKK